MDRRDRRRQDSFLIRPHPDWNHWDENAEMIHGIDRPTLEAEGIDVAHAVRRLERDLTGETVYSDAVEHDRPWMVRLFEAVGRDQLCMRFAHTLSLVPPDKAMDLYQRFDATKSRHRALDDAIKWADILDYVAPI